MVYSPPLYGISFTFPDASTMAAQLLVGPRSMPMISAMPHLWGPASRSDLGECSQEASGDSSAKRAGASKTPPSPGPHAFPAAPFDATNKVRLMRRHADC